MSLWRNGLTWIEGSALGDAVRSAGVWAYGVINLVHILGVALLFGAIVVLDLRLIGWRRGASLAAIASVTVPVATTGFFVAALSGLCLLATNGAEYVSNPFLPIKFVAIALALLNAFFLSRLTAWKTRGASGLASHERKLLAVAGGVSLACWLVAIAAGRLIGYW